VLNACGVGARGSGGAAATALIVEDDLLVLGERREGGPEEVVAEDEAAVDGHEWCSAGHWRRTAHNKVEAADADGLTLEGRGTRARAAPVGEAVFGGGVVHGG
jgi:hypothetical protein